MCGPAAPVSFDPPHMFFSGALTVRLACATPGASIYWTSDCTPPSPTNGHLYTQPVIITDTTVIRARAVAPGYEAGAVAARTYITPAGVLMQTGSGFPPTWGWYLNYGMPTYVQADYAMDQRVVTNPVYRSALTNDLLSLPSLSITCDPADLFGTNGIHYFYGRETLLTGAYWERPCTAELIDPAGIEGFVIDCGVQIQGGASRNARNTLKFSFRLLFKSIYGPSKLSYPFFPDTPVKKFDKIALRAGFNDSWPVKANMHNPIGQYTRDAYTRGVQNDLGTECGRTRFVHLYLNGLYWGLYAATERCEETFAAAYHGGEPEDYDVIMNREIKSGTWDAFTTMFEIANSNLPAATRYQLLDERLDMAAFAGYMAINHWAANADWPNGNWSMFRPRASGGKFTYLCWDAEWTVTSNMPTWSSFERGDLNHVLNQLGRDAAHSPGASYYTSPGRLFWRLYDSPEFRLLYADTVHRLCFNGGLLYVDPNHPAWDPGHPERNRPAARYAATAALIGRAIVCESARWGDASGTNRYLREPHWTGQRDHLLNWWLTNRTAAYVAMCRAEGLYPQVEAPVFSVHGGIVEPGFTLCMTGAAGGVYYTLDGSDPRTPFTGAPSPAALLYNGAGVILASSSHVKARALSGGQWSALNQAAFFCTSDYSRVRLTEIMYKPAGGGSYEFIEIKNTAAVPFPLSGVTLCGGIDARMPYGAMLAPGGFLVLVAEGKEFAERYPQVGPGGRYIGNLAGGRETLVLSDPYGNEIERVTYDAAWYPETDGQGCSLVPEDAGAQGDPNVKTYWRPSTHVNGSPGEDDPLPEPAVPTALAAFLLLGRAARARHG